MLTVSEKLEALATLGVELNRVADLDILMERILSEARHFVNADAGSIYIRDRDRLNFSYTQNATLQKRLPLGEKLIFSTFTVPINEDSISGHAAYTARATNIADVYHLDESVPYSFGRGFDQASGYRTQSMLTLPLVTNRGDVIGVLQIINAQNENCDIVPFAEEDEKMMRHFASTATVALERARMTRAMILRTIRMAEMRDPKETGAHANRVGSYAVEIYEHWARKQGMGDKDIDAKRDVFRMAAMLHDVGKVAISDTILKKPGRFTPEEYEVMKQHSMFGARLFLDRQSEFDDAAQNVALNHHERWDGKGYPGHIDVATGEPLAERADENGCPLGKAGEEIPVFGRIVAIADVFDALCSRRVYKPAWEESEALSVMEEGRGSQFDPDLIDVFFSILDLIRSIRDRYPDLPDPEK
ncbi:MAG: HD domain-containing protein [Proteobacteria bacterium]|nr:HD domain-containing protein [Pseudomonadota bacterium]